MTLYLEKFFARASAVRKHWRRTVSCAYDLSLISLAHCPSTHLVSMTSPSLFCIFLTLPINMPLIIKEVVVRLPFYEQCNC